MLIYFNLKFFDFKHLKHDSVDLKNNGIYDMTLSNIKKTLKYKMNKNKDCFDLLNFSQIKKKLKISIIFIYQNKLYINKFYHNK